MPPRPLLFADLHEEGLHLLGQVSLGELGYPVVIIGDPDARMIVFLPDILSGGELQRPDGEQSGWGNRAREQFETIMAAIEAREGKLPPVLPDPALPGAVVWIVSPELTAAHKLAGCQTAAASHMSAEAREVAEAIERRLRVEVGITKPQGFEAVFARPWGDS